MGGRSDSSTRKLERLDKNDWIQEVSDSRLQAYERMISSAAAPVRADGSERMFQGAFFRDLVRDELARRKK